jgi:hypothetical protein
VDCERAACGYGCADGQHPVELAGAKAGDQVCSKRRPRCGIPAGRITGGGKNLGRNPVVRHGLGPLCSFYRLELCDYQKRYTGHA